MKLSEAVKMYIDLRDQISVKKKAFEEDVAVIKTKMDKIEVKVLELLEQTGTNSINTEFGTAYRTLKTSATVADRDAFLDFCRAREEWALMDIRASKSSIEQWQAANDGQLPPGVNWREERAVNFRR